MNAVVVNAQGFSLDGRPPGWGEFGGERDPLAAAARTFVGARNLRLPRLDRPTVAALVAAHLVLERAQRPRVMIVAVDEGCESADRAYWTTARARGGLDASPSLFAATLPSAVAGELAMTFGLRGPCVVLAGAGSADSGAAASAGLGSVVDEGPCLWLRLHGWNGPADGEARATLGQEGEFAK